MITYRFEIMKIIQIVNLLLKLNNGCLNYTKLIKLLYLVDREALRRWDLTITKDKYVNMSKGPVLSKLYDLIRKRAKPRESQKLWNKYFDKKDFDLIAFDTNNAGDGELSEREIELIKEIDDVYKLHSYSCMIELSHELPEWEDPGTSKRPLSINSILSEIGRSDKEIQDIECENEVYKEEEKLFRIDVREIS